MKFIVVDDQLQSAVAETIAFLCRHAELPQARTLFDSYLAFANLVVQSRADRMEAALVERREREAKALREGTDGLPAVTLAVEKEIDELQCPGLPAAITGLFELLPEATFPSS